MIHLQPLWPLMSGDVVLLSKWLLPLGMTARLSGASFESIMGWTSIIFPPPLIQFVSH